MKKILSLLIGELREKDSNPRPPAYEAGELPLLHLAMCAAYTARCLRPETMRFKDFYRQPIMFHCCTYFSRFCIHKPSKLLPDASIMFSQNNNTLLYCCYDIFNLYTVLIRIHTAEGWLCFVNRADRLTTSKYGITLRNSRCDSAKASACLNQRQSYDTLPPLT